MDVLKTLQYMKPDIKVMVWENDIDQIVYNETEEFRPTKEDILAVDQDAVASYWQQKEDEEKQLTLNDIQDQINNLLNKFQTLKESK